MRNQTIAILTAVISLWAAGSALAGDRTDRDLNRFKQSITSEACKRLQSAENSARRLRESQSWKHVPVRPVYRAAERTFQRGQRQLGCERPRPVTYGRGSARGVR